MVKVLTLIIFKVPYTSVFQTVSRDKTFNEYVAFHNFHKCAVGFKIIGTQNGTSTRRNETSKRKDKKEQNTCHKAKTCH